MSASRPLAKSGHPLMMPKEDTAERRRHARVLVRFTTALGRSYAAPLGFSGLLLVFAASATAAQQYELTQNLRIDGHREDLVPIDWIAVRSDRIIAVAQAQDAVVKVFDAAGRVVATIGRRGSGPGEFRTVARGGWIGDTLWVFDYALHRFTYFKVDGSVLRTLAAPRTARSSSPSTKEFSRVSPMLVFNNGLLHALLGLSQVSVGESVVRGTLMYANLAFDGTIRRLIAQFPEGPYELMVQTSRGVAGVNVPFAIRPFYSIAPDGSRFVQTTIDLETPRRALLNVLMFDASGDTLFKRRYAVPGVPIARSTADSAINATLRRWQSRDPEVAAVLRRELRTPPIYPPILDVVVGNDGSVWFRLRDEGQRRPYWIIDRHGEPVGTAALPLNATLVAVHDDHAWTLESDTLGVQSVVRYRMRPIVRGDYPASHRSPRYVIRRDR